MKLVKGSLQKTSGKGEGVVSKFSGRWFVKIRRPKKIDSKYSHSSLVVISINWLLERSHMTSAAGGGVLKC